MLAVRSTGLFPRALKAWPAEGTVGYLWGKGGHRLLGPWLFYNTLSRVPELRGGLAGACRGSGVAERI